MVLCYGRYSVTLPVPACIARGEIDRAAELSTDASRAQALHNTTRPFAAHAVQSDCTTGVSCENAVDYAPVPALGRMFVKV